MNGKEINVSISNLGLGYAKGSQIFPSISIDANCGELVALVGRNGIGKSTLLRTIIGYQKPLNGKISVLNTSVENFTRQQLAQIISFVPSEPVKVSNLFIRDFVALARFPYTGWANSLSASDWQTVYNALQQVGINHLAGRDITAVSDGERQRAMIAFALAQDTDIILMDEPTAFLDLPNKFEMVRLLSQLAHQRNKTIIYSTHDLQGAMSEADIIWMMLDTGILTGSPEDIALQDNFRKLLENTQVVFDTHKGMFKNFRPQTKAIALDGQGSIYSWTAKMLERLGFLIDNSHKQKLKIIAGQKDDSSYWKLFKKDYMIGTYNSLAQLSRKIRQIEELNHDSDINQDS